MLFLVCAALALCYGASASPLADQYIDSVLFSALPSQIRAMNLDPAPLPNFYTEVYETYFGIKVKEKLNFTSGALTGLGGVRRFSSCGGPTYKYGVPTINCTIGFSNLHANYNGTMEYANIRAFTVSGNATVGTTSLFIEVSSPSPNQPPSLNALIFQQVGEVKSKFPGVGIPLNEELKALEDGFNSHVKAEVMKLLSEEYRYAMTVAVSQVPMPR